MYSLLIIDFNYFPSLFLSIIYHQKFLTVFLIIMFSKNCNKLLYQSYYLCPFIMWCTNLLKKEEIKGEFIKTIRAILIKVLHVNEWCWLVSWDWLGPLYKWRRMVVERKWFLSRWKYWWSSHYDKKEVKSIHVHVTIIDPECLLWAEFCNRSTT